MRVLVTGASRGIGRATAIRLAAPGVEIGVHYFEHAAEAGEVAREVERRGGRAIREYADLSRPSEARALASRIRARWSTLDGLVLNAGVYPRTPFAELTPDEVAACFAVNLFGPIELTRSLLPALVAADDPRVVFVSSILAEVGSLHGAHYAAAKAAVVGLARSLARELAPKLKVNVVAPGSIDTAILAGDTPEKRAERERGIPLRRLGTPGEVAEAIAFLLGPGGSYLTGATLSVNGGLAFP